MFTGSKGGPKRPRFFCENCGAEVSGNADKCPECGRYFASVRCPSCGFAGEGVLFKGGCPACGYSVPKSSGGRMDFPETGKPAGALPFWVYILTAAAFTGILAALFFAALK